MVDQLGKLQLPASPTDDPAGDPVLTLLLQFWKQCLSNNLTALWGIVQPNKPVVQTIDNRNVIEETCTSSELPALFIYRDSFDPLQWLAHDYRIANTRLVLQWVMPRLELKWRRNRSTILNAAMAALQFPTEQTGRAPGLIFAGDTDPRATAEGSLLWPFANIFNLQFGKVSLDQLKVSLGKEGFQIFDAVTWRMTLCERFTPDLTKYAVLDSVIGTMQTSGYQVETFQYGLRFSSITPATGTAAGGTAVTLQGTGFTAFSTITIGGALCTSVAVSSDGTILTATTPAGAVGSVNVVITNPGLVGETATLVAGYTYT